jgi:hypothetical protein
MTLLNAFALLGDIRTYRVVYIEGRYGGGKTSLAFKLASTLLDSGKYRYLLTNCMTTWADRPEDVILRNNAKGIPQFADCVVIMDEAGLFLKYGRDADQFLSFLRKFNIVLILPSKEEVSRKLRSLRVQRIMNLETIGLPIWVYTYGLSYGQQKERSSFIWVNPGEIFGYYDTDDTPADDAGLADWFNEQKNKAIETSVSRQKSSGVRKVDRRDGAFRQLPQMEGFEGVDRVADAIEEAAGNIDEVSTVLEQSSRQRRR